MNSQADRILAEITDDGSLWLAASDQHSPAEDSAVGKVILRGAAESLIDPWSDHARDSHALFRVPSQDLDDDQLFNVAVVVYSSARSVPVAVISEEASTLPEPVLLDVARRVALAMIDESDGGFVKTDLAREFKGMAIGMLGTRIFAIEQSVRDALDDEELTQADYRALRDYPKRLAIVESLAYTIQSPEPSWESLRPRPQGMFAVTVPIAHPDFFFKHANEVAADAKQAVTRLSGLLASQQVVMTQRQRVEVERLQRVVTVVGAAVLVPGLVAAIFGANVSLPGQGSSKGFAAMLLLMVAGGALSYALLRSVELGLWPPAFRNWMRARPAWFEPVVIGGFGLVLACVAAVILA